MLKISSNSIRDVDTLTVLVSKSVIINLKPLTFCGYNGATLPTFLIGPVSLVLAAPACVVCGIVIASVFWCVCVLGGGGGVTMTQKMLAHTNREHQFSGLLIVWFWDTAYARETDRQREGQPER